MDAGVFQLQNIGDSVLYRSFSPIGDGLEERSVTLKGILTFQNLRYNLSFLGWFQYL
jgi:hypothetical protein